jgi:protein-S-isoprenylcysteine O-methyltransferase Ste14
MPLDMFQQLANALGLHLPPYGMGGALLILFYVIQAEIRFGSRARSSAAGASDRGSTRALSLSSTVPIIGFALVMQTRAAVPPLALPAWLIGSDTLPGMPAFAWVGVGLGFAGLALRLWAVLTLRQRYTRTLLVTEGHAIERGGPYRFVRHPGYLGSLLCLNGVALASGSPVVAVVSIGATFAAYAYRIRVEDAMLVAAFGAPYENYRREVRALLPFVR